MKTLYTHALLRTAFFTGVLAAGLLVSGGRAEAATVSPHIQEAVRAQAAEARATLREEGRRELRALARAMATSPLPATTVTEVATGEAEPLVPLSAAEQTVLPHFPVLELITLMRASLHFEALRRVGVEVALPVVIAVNQR
ncbi:MAG TPA: hypothetical protein VNL72_00675 [Gammaproteobacteria bacterium]|nr:hypothetical protein [Gammaproteobacteria bacterium]